MAEKGVLKSNHDKALTPDMDQGSPFPKSRINILLLENVHPVAVEILKREGFNVETHPASMSEDELLERIADISVLGIRSKTKVTDRVLEKARRLMLIGAFCIGTNQIDLQAATRRGIAVFNAPFSNTRSVVELVIAEIIMLLRRIPDKTAGMHKGIWDKSSEGSFEVRGKTLGIAGYGNIGTQLSVLAESLGMKVFYYDVEEKLAMGNAVRCATMKELLEASDVVSLHVDGRGSNSVLIGDREFGWMKKGVIFINMSRGHVVDFKALRENVLSGKVGGCAVDVFPEEPAGNRAEFDSGLMGLPNTILTPHIGGSTVEAQENIGHFVPGKIIDYINTGSTSNSVNFPNLSLPAFDNAHRLIHIHSNVPGILAGINQILAGHGINILGQYLKTNEIIGYVITDISRVHDRSVLHDLRRIDNTIKFRILY